MTIAIDGPVASGKTTVGRTVARKLGFRFLDTGWMYRAVAHAGLRSEFDLHNQDEMTRLVEGLTMRLVESERGERLFVDGEDVTDRLHEHRLIKGRPRSPRYRVCEGRSYISSAESRRMGLS